MDTLCFKMRDDLVRPSAEQPEALTAQFLIAVRLCLSVGTPASTKDLLKVDVARWAREHSGLAEKRDLREVQTLMAVLHQINSGRLPEAVDIISQRAKGILQAKAPKGSWEKAQVIELVMTGNGIVPQSEIALTGLGGV